MPRHLDLDFNPWLFAQAAPDVRRAHRAWLDDLVASLPDAAIGADVFISQRANVRTTQLRLGDRCLVAADCHLTGGLHAGDDCSFNRGVSVRGSVRLGRAIRIGEGARLLGFNHGHADLERPIMAQPLTSRGIVVEDDVWIGAGAIILDGVQVGAHSIVGAGAVVTRDVPAWSVVAGNPARLVRDRRSPPLRSGSPASLAAFVERVSGQIPEIIGRHAAGGGWACDDVGGAPTIRATADRVELALAIGDAAQTFDRDAAAAVLTGAWDALAQRAGPAGPLTDLDTGYDLLAMAEALTALGRTIPGPVPVLVGLAPTALLEVLPQLPWETHGWNAGAWVDQYATLTTLPPGAGRGGETQATLRRWLAQQVDPVTGLWSGYDRRHGWLLAVNGAYRIARRVYAGERVPLPHPAALIDTVLAHVRDVRWFGDGRGDACAWLDAAFLLYCATRQCRHRVAEATQWAVAARDRLVGAWQDGRGWSFAVDARAASLKGTEMGLATLVTLSALCGDPLPGVRFRGVHRIDVTASPGGADALTGGAAPR